MAHVHAAIPHESMAIAPLHAWCHINTTEACSTMPACMQVEVHGLICGTTPNCLSMYMVSERKVSVCPAWTHADMDKHWTVPAKQI